MKKILLPVLVLTLLLVSCGGQNLSNAIDPNLKQYVSGSFELYHPKSWVTVQSESGYATVYSIDSLTLISFSRAAGLDVEETYEKFKGGFLSKGELSEVETPNNIDVEIIKYNGYVNNFVYKTVVSEGTIALWNNGKTSYALLDVADTHQADGSFAAIYNSFKYLR